MNIFIYLNIQGNFIKKLSILLIFCLLFEFSCATTRKLPVSSYHPKELMEYETIIVTLKNGQKFTLTNFAITDLHIVGVVVLRPTADKIQISERIKIIKLEDIKFIQIKNPPSNPTGVCIGVLAGVGLIGVIIIITCAAAND